MAPWSSRALIGSDTCPISRPLRGDEMRKNYAAKVKASPGIDVTTPIRPVRMRANPKPPTHLRWRSAAPAKARSRRLPGQDSCRYRWPPRECRRVHFWCHSRPSRKIATSNRSGQPPSQRIAVRRERWQDWARSKSPRIKSPTSRTPSPDSGTGNAIRSIARAR